MSGPAIKATEMTQYLSQLPPSMNGNPLLYATALTSVMCIAALGLLVAGWMLRDTWRDRFNVHPKSILFNFRAMMGLAGFAAFIRAMPEVLYLQIYGDPDISNEIQAMVTTLKRVTDSLALGFVLGWMLLLVAIYPHVCLALKQGPSQFVEIDRVGVWPRLARPFMCFICIALVSMTFTYAKVYGN